jgi:hypothetical protein
MSPEFDKALCTAYPLIFKKRNSPTAAISWGFEVGDGWYQILDVLCSMLYFDYASAKERYEALRKREAKPSEVEAARLKMLAAARLVPVVEQVKSKFGTLRFYARKGTAKHHAYVEFAECISGRVCEVCGAPGKRREVGWVSTLCDVHDAESGAGLKPGGQRGE